MENFEFLNPVKIYFGKGQIEKIKEAIPKGSRVMLTYGGGSIKKNGVYIQIVEALQGFDWVEFGGIEPNPRYETLMKAIKIAKKNQVNYLLAVGGGSVIDGTKFLSCAINYEGDNHWDLIEKGLSREVENVTPFGTVLTLPATGSEMNSGAVVTKEETQDKRAFGGPRLFPKFSVLDPTVISSLPKKQISNGVIDAFVHVLEQYITYPNHSMIQDRYAEGILSTLIEIGPKVLENQTDYDYQSNFMWAATNALNGFLRLGVPTDWATHMIGHELTAKYEIDHGRTLAIIWPNLAKVMIEDKKVKLTQYANRVWGINTGDILTDANTAIQKTKEFFETLGVATKISDYTDSAQEIIPFVKEKFEDRGWDKLGENGIVTIDKVEEILEHSI